MQRNRTLHIMKKIHFEDLDVIGLSDEYLYLLKGPATTLVLGCAVPQHGVTARALQLALIPILSLL